VAVVAGIGATIRLTRPPDLVRWTSPAIGDSGRHLRVLIPQGWYVRFQANLPPETEGCWWMKYEFTPTDHRPMFLVSLLPRNQEHAVVAISFGHDPQMRTGEGIIHTGPIPWYEVSALPYFEAQKSVGTPDHKTVASVSYVRTDHAAFNITQAAICNSLRIE